MPDGWRPLVGLVIVFSPLSLFSVGGGASLVAEIAHQAITVHGWTTPREFADLFAISRAAPGPGTMLGALIGWKVAGVPGAMAASLALYVPSSLFVYAAARLWDDGAARPRSARSNAAWRRSPPGSSWRVGSRCSGSPGIAAAPGW